MPEVIPYQMIKPLVRLGDDVTGVEMQCYSNNVAVEVEQDETTSETYCGTYTNYKPEVWTITLTVLQSFGADGLWTMVKPLVGTTVEFAILPDADQPVSVDNPIMTGTARVKAFPFLSGAVNETNEFDIELGVQGMPTWSITEPAGLAAEPEPQPA